MFSVTLINTCVGVVVSVGLYFMKVPNATMWGVLVAVLNFVPYFGPMSESSSWPQSASSPSKRRRRAPAAASGTC